MQRFTETQTCGWLVLFVLFLCLFLLNAVGSGGGGSSCYVDWDGRSNPIVCR